MPGMQSNYAAHDDDAPPARKKTLRVLTGLGIVAAAAAALVMLVSVLSPGNARPRAGDAAAPAATAETAGSSEEGLPDGQERATVAEGVDVPDGLDIDTVYVSEGSPPLTQEQVEALDPANEYVVECTDPAALEAHAGHEPAGWPQDWEPGDPLLDPECHPDFIEVHTWDRFEEFHECREGIETSTIVRTPEMTDQAAYRAAWEQSRARATWEPEQTCEEMLSHLSDWVAAPRQLRHGTGAAAPEGGPHI